MATEHKYAKKTKDKYFTSFISIESKSIKKLAAVVVVIEATAAL